MSHAHAEGDVIVEDGLLATAFEGKRVAACGVLRRVFSVEGLWFAEIAGDCYGAPIVARLCDTVIEATGERLKPPPAALAATRGGV